MKAFLFAIAMVLLYTIFLLYQVDNNAYIRELQHLKQTADESAASASLYYNIEQHAEGKTVYNQIESLKAIKYILKKNLQLDEMLYPTKASYWQGIVEYDVYFYDHSNTIFPYLYIDKKTNYQKLLTKPIVIVTLKSKARFRLNFLVVPDAIRTSAYEYLER